jgi:hypothetical protein
MYGAMSNWLNFIAGCVPVRISTSVRSMASRPSNQ